MKANIKIKNILCQIRERPTDSSPVTKILDPSEAVYLVTGYIKGWYFIEEFYSWIKTEDCIVVEKLEDFEEDDFSNGSVSEDHSTVLPTDYDGEAIINAINGAIKNKIEADKIYFVDGDHQYNLQTLLKSLNSSLVDIQDAVRKIANYPDIPAIPANSTNGMALVIETDINGKKICTWTKVKYPDLANIPDTSQGSEW